MHPETLATATTTTNYQERLSGTGFGEISKLFQDLFELAALLGIKYAWIDSLCIIQDAADDWKEESLKMSDYYQNAEFTVSAINIPQIDGLKISQQRLPLESLPMARLPYRNRQGGQNGHFYVYPQNSASFLDEDYRRHTNNAEVLSRGWVFQEWILSRRIVCFTPSGLYLQCRCPDKSPINQHGEAVDRDLTKRSNIELSFKASLSLEFRNTEGIYFAWEEIVEQYCKLKLSRPQEDRIIALGGIATELQKALHMEDNCVAGLWKNDLHQGLLWEKSRPGTLRRFDSFPTWSWASIDKPVNWPGRERLTLNCDLGFDLMEMPIWGVRDPRTINCVFTGTAKISDEPFHLLSLPGQASAAAEADATTIQLPNSIESTSSDRRHVEGNFVLHVSGRLQPVLIGSYFEDEASFYLATDVTGHPARSIGAEKQRAVAVPGERNIIAGWASLEHPEFQDDAAFSPGPVILALLVSTKHVSAGAFGLGFVSSSHKAFLVLFLRRSDKVMDGFERVGVGRLFGWEAARGFELAIERDIRLI